MGIYPAINGKRARRQVRSVNRIGNNDPYWFTALSFVTLDFDKNPFTMEYTALDTQFLSREFDLNKAIKAKKDIQNIAMAQVTQGEALQLSQDRLPQSLVEKVRAVGKTYLTSRRDTDVYAVALAVGTIIKELDNGNTSHVTGPAVAEIMNWLIR